MTQTRTVDVRWAGTSQKSAATWQGETSKTQTTAVLQTAPMETIVTEPTTELKSSTIQISIKPSFVAHT